MMPEADYAFRPSDGADVRGETVAMPLDAEQLFARRLEAWRAHDIDALVAMHTEDCVLESPIAGRVVGRAAIESVYRGFVTSFPDMTVSDPDAIYDGDRAVQCVTFSGTTLGGVMGVAATGKRFTFSAVLICTLRDGRISHERRVYDFTGFLVEIGVLKARPV